MWSQQVRRLSETLCADGFNEEWYEHASSVIMKAPCLCLVGMGNSSILEKLLLGLDIDTSRNTLCVDLKTVLTKICTVYECLSEEEVEVFSTHMQKMDVCETDHNILDVLKAKRVHPMLINLISRKIRIVQEVKYFFTIACNRDWMLDMDNSTAQDTMSASPDSNIPSSNQTVTDEENGQAEDYANQVDQTQIQPQLRILEEPFYEVMNLEEINHNNNLESSCLLEAEPQNGAGLPRMFGIIQSCDQHILPGYQISDVTFAKLKDFVAGDMLEDEV
jgi:hypothetical protein